MKIVVTGAAGFIGSHLCERLVTNGHNVTGIDCFDDFLYSRDDKQRNAIALESLSATQFSLHKADICDEDRMAHYITPDTDLVCHLAALAGVRPSLADPRRYIRTNLDGTTVLLEQCRKANVKRFVFASSSSVYGEETGTSASCEANPCVRPASIYAATKRSGELLCSSYTDLFGIGVAALRYFTVYGPRQRTDMAISKFVGLIASNQPIEVFGDGSSKRDYTYVDDIVSGTVAACERMVSGRFTAYNLGGSDTTSLSDLVHTIQEVVGKPAQVIQKPDQPGDVPSTFADISLARAELDYQPTVALREGITRYWNWWTHQQ